MLLIDARPEIASVNLIADTGLRSERAATGPFSEESQPCVPRQFFSRPERRAWRRRRRLRGMKNQPTGSF